MYGACILGLNCICWNLVSSYMLELHDPKRTPQELAEKIDALQKEIDQVNPEAIGDSEIPPDARYRALTLMTLT